MRVFRCSAVVFVAGAADRSVCDVKYRLEGRGRVLRPNPRFRQQVQLCCSVLVDAAIAFFEGLFGRKRGLKFRVPMWPDGAEVSGVFYTQIGRFLVGRRISDLSQKQWENLKIRALRVSRLFSRLARRAVQFAGRNVEAGGGSILRNFEKQFLVVFSKHTFCLISHFSGCLGFVREEHRNVSDAYSCLSRIFR